MKTPHIRHALPATALLSLVTGCQQDNFEKPSIDPTAEPAASFERLDPAFDVLVSLDATVDKVASGFIFVEGPVWVAGEPGALLFIDIPAYTVYRWAESEGAEVLLHPVTAPDANTGGVGGSNGRSTSQTLTSRQLGYGCPTRCKTTLCLAREPSSLMAVRLISPAMQTV